MSPHITAPSLLCNRNTGTMDSSSTNDAGIFDDSLALTALWVCAAVFFLLCPFLASSNRRKVCAARIRQRRWNAGQNRDWYREAAERLEERYVGIVSCRATALDCCPELLIEAHCQGSQVHKCRFADGTCHDIFDACTKYEYFFLLSKQIAS